MIWINKDHVNFLIWIVIFLSDLFDLWDLQEQIQTMSVITMPFGEWFGREVDLWIFMVEKDYIYYNLNC